MPTTDEQDKYEEGERRRDADSKRADRFWAFIFNLIVAVAAGAAIAIIIALLNR